MKISRVILTSVMICTCSLAIISSQAHASNKDSIKVMSRNLYLGADLFPVIAAAKEAPNSLPFAVSDVFQSVVASNFPERAQEIADEIENSNPDIIGLQEVSLWFTGPADSLLGGTNPATDLVYDYLDILLSALNDRGLNYIAISILSNADLELPMITGVDESGVPSFLDLRLVDRDVILVKDSTKITANVSQEQNFQMNLQIPLAGTVVEFTRGFQTVEINIDGADYFFVNTHLEVGGTEPFISFQALQMRELLSEIAHTNGNNFPVILTGDFNSDPRDEAFTSMFGEPLSPPYEQAITASYFDLWLEGNNPKDGFTCCFDSAVNDPSAQLFERIDHVFFNPKDKEIKKMKLTITGNTSEDMTSVSELYPSDHAGVIGKIDIYKE